MSDLCKQMNAQPGDIWGTPMGKEYLIIAKHSDDLYTVLGLFDTYKTGAVEIKSRQIMYTNPAMVQYLFGSVMSQYIKTLPEAEFETIAEAVQDALCMTLIKYAPVEDTKEVLALKTMLEEREKLINSLAEKLEMGEKKRIDLVKQLGEMKHCKEVYQQLYITTLDKVIMMEEG